MKPSKRQPQQLAPRAAGSPDIWERAAWLLVLIGAVIPIWAARDLPMVDLPQHLYLLDVARRLHDGSTLYPSYFQFDFRFTPYLGYYALMGLLNQVIPLELANRLFMSFVVLGVPGSAAFLLRSLRRQTWPALLVVPFAYGDCFAWGFVNTCAAIPIALVTLGAFIRALEAPARNSRWALLFALGLLAGFFMHPAPTIFLAAALPVMLWTTSSPGDTAGQGLRNWLARRAIVLAGMVPFLLATGTWLALVAANPASSSSVASHTDPGLVWETPQANLQALPWLLANIFNNGADQIGLYAVVSVALLAIVSQLFGRVPSAQSGRERLRPYALVAICFAMFMSVPLSIGGMVQYLSPRFAPLAAILAAALVPRTSPRWSKVLMAGATMAVAIAVTILTLGFRAYSAEAAAVHRLSSLLPDRPRIMGLIYEPGSVVVHHPVYLHATATMARTHGGVPSYTLMNWRQVSLKYRTSAPPALPSEWTPDRFDYDAMAQSYDYFLVRGRDPATVFGAHLGKEIGLMARDGDWSILRRIR